MNGFANMLLYSFAYVNKSVYAGLWHLDIFIGEVAEHVAALAARSAGNVRTLGDTWGPT